MSTRGKSIRDEMRERAHLDKRCEGCSRPLTGNHVLASLCYQHLRRRSNYGSAKLRKFVPRSAWRSILPLVRAYMKDDPPDASTLAAMARVLEPGNPPPRSMKSTHPHAVLYRELRWYEDPRAKIKLRQGETYSRQRLRDGGDYSPLTLLQSLVAVIVYMEDRSEMFKEDREDVTLGRTLSAHWRRPRYPSGHINPIRGTTSRLLAKRIRANLGVYLLVTARAVIKATAAERALATKQQPPTPPQPPPPTLRSPAPRLTIQQRLIAEHVTHVSMNGG